MGTPLHSCALWLLGGSKCWLSRTRSAGHWCPPPSPAALSAPSTFGSLPLRVGDVRFHAGTSGDVNRTALSATRLPSSSPDQSEFPAPKWAPDLCVPTCVAVTLALPPPGLCQGL